MDRDLVLPTWAKEWTSRTHVGLYYASTLIFAVLSITAVVLGLQALIHLRACRTDILKDPSSRMALFAACNKRVRSITKSQLFVAAAFATHAFVLYSVDVAICMAAIWNDASENSDRYTSSLAIELAHDAVGIAAATLAACVIFPLAQVFLFGALLARSQRRLNPEATLAAYIPEARIMTTHLGQLWSMMAFCLVAYWPTFERTVLRLSLAEAAFATAMVWLHLSYRLTFREDLVAGVLEGSPHSALEKQTLLLFSGSTIANSLPTYDAINRSESVRGEKQEV
ncbi:unnamed protein product [Zymoseptoria tritici ST99CH_1A5]|uniref:CSC1/OSCA1-like 7TM region domain-containing protein n=3 Tax=Zymoseptoria tritici TaxID=1047171 RepID=A0A1X7RFV0_ZYMT9|nr:unnamed protein product [Zymoseptoria tritici ST99CH_3D7]SMR42622.1 unnamed protein product [Zymoseptoria tritici ST99CH_1E4]SMY19960.1 unnamed protein product [Zymoseptoria tritici ST99CH_1A5]